MSETTLTEELLADLETKALAAQTALPSREERYSETLNLLVPFYNAVSPEVVLALVNEVWRLRGEAQTTRAAALAQAGEFADFFKVHLLSEKMRALREQEPLRVFTESEMSGVLARIAYLLEVGNVADAKDLVHVQLARCAPSSVRGGDQRQELQWQRTRNGAYEDAAGVVRSLVTAASPEVAEVLHTALARILSLKQQH